MDFKLLTEKHNLCYGDTVTVYERNNRILSFTGTVSKIINKKVNQYDVMSYYVDYIYIKFSKNVYNH